MKPGLDNLCYADTGFDIDADLETDIVTHLYRDNHFVDALLIIVLMLMPMLMLINLADYVNHDVDGEH